MASSPPFSTRAATAATRTRGSGAHQTPSPKPPSSLRALFLTRFARPPSLSCALRRALRVEHHLNLPFPSRLAVAFSAGDHPAHIVYGENSYGGHNGDDALNYGGAYEYSRLLVAPRDFVHSACVHTPSLDERAACLILVQK